MLTRIKRLNPVGKRAFLPPTEKTLPGHCTWCGQYSTRLDRDHILARGWFTVRIELRDNPRNLVPACRHCNRRRADGWKPSFLLLPKRSQEFCLAVWRPTQLAKRFTEVPGA
jgi:hypothetical protein